MVQDNIAGRHKSIRDVAKLTIYVAWISLLEQKSPLLGIQHYLINCGVNVIQEKNIQ